MKNLALLLVASMPFCGLAHAADATQQVDLLQSGVDVGDVFVRRTTTGGARVAIRIVVDDGVTTAGHVYQLVLRVFNNPQHCAIPNSCSLTDLPANGGSTLVDGSLILVTAGIAEATGNQFFGRLYTAPAGNVAVAQVRQGHGLVNLFGAQLEVLLRDMDAAQPDDDLFDQMYDIQGGGGCGSTLVCSILATSALIVP